MKEEYKKIIEAAQAGGQVLKHYFGQNLDVEQKTIPADVRTKADLESEQAILKVLKENFSDYNIHSEEIDNIENGSEYTFVIDPLDASNNFILGIPNFSVIIALQKNKETIFGVVYQPILDLSYYASKDGGAFLNGQPINVNQKETVEDSTVAIVWGYEHDKALDADYTKKIIESEIKRMCFNWSVGIDFALLASGQIEAILHDNCDLHDFLAGKLIAKEAGAMITDLDGQPEKDDENTVFLMSNNKKINTKVLEILK
ncbi:MAG: inositol monophosphatase [Candidatus Komeilibacteria bacterium]|jgi:myo-inositol-1(or 4)-monophosphatase|nr:inositol monophosphatase [Candidatus Komeilibacteria bacterium]MBT4447913.1 inositol monophosphatase [Candidatus Komeilibacteria bacterium]